MDLKSGNIDELLRKLNILISKQDVLSKEIEEIKAALEGLRQLEAEDEKKIRSGKEQDSVTSVLPKYKPQPIREEEASAKAAPVAAKPLAEVKDRKADHEKKKGVRPISVKIPDSIQTNLEDFIGTNLINKVGILILIIGIGIGTKFAIDKNLISPMVRLILGYILGGALLFFAYRLKKNYHNFSAVLCSGAMAILYFMTYAGTAIFDILSVAVAFSAMVVITIFTVYQSLEYNRQVLSIIGLAGAYAIPFLIGGEPDRYVFLFTYITIINMGILAVAVKKYWQLLYYVAFAATWIIYVLWWQDIDFEIKTYFQHANLFSGLFFLIFYCAFLVNKVLGRKKFSPEDVVLILANSFIFYGLGYFSYDNERWGNLLGMFTLINASVHLLVWVIIYYRKDRDDNLLKLIFSLVITFITISIPVEFDGNWVTLFWGIEGTALFIIGRTRKAYFYEYFAYPLLVFALYSLLDDWRIAFEKYASLTYEPGYHFFFNVNFLIALLIIVCLGINAYINFHPKYPIRPGTDTTFKAMIQYFLVGALILVTYYTFRFEIAIYFRQLYADSVQAIPVAGSGETLSIRNEDILNFKTIWILVYSMVFFSLVLVANVKKIRNEDFGYLALMTNALVLIVFLMQGLLILSELRGNYIQPAYPDTFIPGAANIYIRYLGIAIFAYVLVIMYWQSRQKYLKRYFKIYLDLFTSLAVLWILSSELIHWLDLGASQSSYKLGLSILWGSYSLFLIVVGIWKKMKYLRIAAILLFGITLIKLAAYDISEMDTLSKTIVFILLGILLLVISFLYNKYRKIIF